MVHVVVATVVEPLNDFVAIMPYFCMMATREQNEHRFDWWQDLPNAGRRYENHQKV
jgi:hypothetical protein